MAVEYAYYYAIIDLETGICLGIADDTSYIDEPEYIQIPEYNRDYLLKYYNRTDGKWYYDAEFQNEVAELND